MSLPWLVITCHTKDPLFRLRLLCSSFSSSSILQQLSINRRRRKVNISHNRTTNKDILDGAQVRIFQFLYHLNVVELNVEVLVHAFQNALELDVVFELHGDLMVDERLEETEEEHDDRIRISATLLKRYLGGGVIFEEVSAQIRVLRMTMCSLLGDDVE